MEAKVKVTGTASFFSATADRQLEAALLGEGHVNKRKEET